MFNENLKRLLKEQGLSQQRFGELLGVSNQSVSAWVQGRKIPRMKMLLAISDLLQCPVNVLVDSEPPHIRQEIDMALNRLTEAQLSEVLNYVKYLGSKK